MYNISEVYYVKYHIHGFGPDPIIMYNGPHKFEHVAESHQKDIAGFTGISDCVIIDKSQFELDQQMNNTESS